MSAWGFFEFLKCFIGVPLHQKRCKPLLYHVVRAEVVVIVVVNTIDTI